MSIETGLYNFLISDTTINGLISDRVRPLMLPQGCTLPAISYKHIEVSWAETIPNGPFGWVWARFQIDSWMGNYEDVRTLADAVRDALDGYKGNMGDVAKVGGVYIESERDLYEQAIEVYRVTMVFLIPYMET